MRTTRKKQVIRTALFRLGLHAPAKAVVHALSEQGIRADEQLVRQVQIQLLKETTGARVSTVPGPVSSPAVRRRPQGFPGRHQG
jgi:hypothetical protein